MNTTKLGFYLELGFWALYVAILSVIKFTDHIGLAVLASAAFIGLGLWLWIWDYFRAVKTKDKPSLIAFVISLVLKCDVMVASVFFAAGYPGKYIVGLAAFVLIWVYVITMLCKKQWGQALFTLFILQFVVTFSERFLS